MSAHSDNPQQRKKDPFAIAVLIVICIALLIYKLALAWTPIWLDLSVGLFAGVVFLLTKLDNNAKPKKNADEKSDTL